MLEKNDGAGLLSEIHASTAEMALQLRSQMALLSAVHEHLLTLSQDGTPALSPSGHAKSVMVTPEKTLPAERLALLPADSSQRLAMLGRLAAGIAHDFNNLLQVMLTYNHIVLDSLDTTTDSKAHCALEKSCDAGTKAGALIRMLLDYCRSPLSELPASPLNPQYVIGDLVATLEGLLPKGIALTTTIAPCPDIVIPAVHLEQIVTNLVVNARDALGNNGVIDLVLSPHTFGTPMVCQTCYEVIATHPDSAWVVLSVRDNGCGIAADLMETLFQPFVTTKALAAGTGLGLAIINDLVHGAKGHVFCDSEIAIGTCFRMIFPAVF